MPENHSAQEQKKKGNQAFQEILIFCYWTNTSGQLKVKYLIDLWLLWTEIKNAGNAQG